MTTTTSQLLQYILPNAQQYNMGMAVQDEHNHTNIYSSDNPEAHAREAKNTYEIVQGYLNSEAGNSFVDYVHSRGKEFMKIKGIGSGDLGEGVVAAILRNNLEGILLSNYDGKGFEERISEMADKYHLTHEATTEYVLAHELAHAAGYKAEAETEGFIKQYFETRAFQTEGEEREKYVQLAGVAAVREKEMEEITK